MSKFDFDRYVTVRKKFRRYGVIGTFIALFNLADASIPFPIPLTGALAVYVSIFILIPSLACIIYYYLPPTIRTVEHVAKETNGYLIATYLVDRLDLTSNTAEQLIYDLFMKGYLNVVNKVDNKTPITQWVCQFVGVAKSDTNQVPATQNRNSPDFDLAAYTENNPELSVDDINALLLTGSMNIGPSGQPNKPTRRRT